MSWQEDMSHFIPNKRFLAFWVQLWAVLYRVLDSDHTAESVQITNVPVEDAIYNLFLQELRIMLGARNMAQRVMSSQSKSEDLSLDLKQPGLK